MITLSVCIIVKNNEKNIASFLSSIDRFADEIIVIDLGSSDNTVQIANNYTSCVASYAFNYDYSAIRNYSLTLCSTDYIMWLDISDSIDEANIKKILKLKETSKNNIDIYMINYDVYSDSSSYCDVTYLREGLVRLASNPVWKEPVHEYIEFAGDVFKTDIHIKHMAEKDSEPPYLEIYKKLEEKGEKLSARSTYYYAKELALHELNKEAINKYNAFLEMEDGFLEDKIAACFDLSFCQEKIQDYLGMLSSLLETFQYSVPRAEICCRIGDYFMHYERYEEAIYWFETALNLPKPDSYGLVQLDYYGYIPHLWLCVLYYQQGNIEKAKYHNDCAAKIKPDDEAVLYNSELLK